MPDLPPTALHRTASGSVAPTYFEALYHDRPDPWDYGTSEYESSKYADTLRALPRDRYSAALEVGCSIGVLTEALAARCGALLALDVSPDALARARSRCACLPHVRFRRAAVPDQTPAGPFDLAVVSEVGYYLSPPDLARLRHHLTEAVLPGGHLVLVHWTGRTDYPLSADDVHGAFAAAPAWSTREDTRREAYRLTVLERTEASGHRRS